MLFEHVLSLNLGFAHTDDKVTEIEEWMDKNPDERFVKKQLQIRETLKNNIKFYKNVSSSEVWKVDFWKNV